MKTKIIICCLSALLLYTFYSCQSFLPPNSTISTEYFSVVSPDEEDWSISTDCETGKVESICLEKGSTGGMLYRKVEYPLQKYQIVRKRISVTTVDKNILLATINEVVRDEILKRLNNYVPGGEAPESLGEVIPIWRFFSNNINEKDYYRFGCGGHGCLGEYYIYLPKEYDEYQCYYLFQYKMTNIFTSGREDEYTSQYISDKLLSFVKNFKCIEDSIDVD